MDKVKSLQEYLDRVMEICEKWGYLTSTTHPWFRGEADVSWKLKPRVYREGSSDKEREMIRDFKLRAPSLMDKPHQDDMELFFIMQHYGVPTRLIDWTESHLIALFFAAEKGSSNTDGRVWILAPASLNEVSSNEVGGRVPMSSDEVFQHYTINVDARPLVRYPQSKTPLAVRPLRSSSRIVAQRGMFTIHGSQRASLDDYAEDTKDDTKAQWLHQVVIDGEMKLEIKKALLIGGICYSNLFPDLEGLSKEIEYRYSSPYLGLALPPNI